MKMLKNEKIIYQTKNERFKLTNFRLREENERILGKTIKSIMLEEITSCEMRTLFNIKFIKWALGIFIYLNGFVYIFNHFLITAEISKFFFGPDKIPTNVALTIFYISIFIMAILIWLFFMSVKRVATFYSPGMEINIFLKWLDDDVREAMIGKVEQAKNDRLLFLEQAGDD